MALWNVLTAINQQARAWNFLSVPRATLEFQGHAYPVGSGNIYM
jgi:hypothetical protein